MLFLQFPEVLKIARINVDDKKKDVSYIKREYSGLPNPNLTGQSGTLPTHHIYLLDYRNCQEQSINSRLPLYAISVSTSYHFSPLFHPHV